MSVVLMAQEIVPEEKEKTETLQLMSVNRKIHDDVPEIFVLAFSNLEEAESWWRNPDNKRIVRKHFGTREYLIKYGEVRSF